MPHNHCDMTAITSHTCNMTTAIPHNCNALAIMPYDCNVSTIAPHDHNMSAVMPHHDMSAVMPHNYDALAVVQHDHNVSTITLHDHNTTAASASAIYYLLLCSMSRPGRWDQVIGLIFTCRTARLLLVTYDLISSFLPIVVARYFLTFPVPSPSFLSLPSPSGTFCSRLLNVLLPSSSFCMLLTCFH